jgi:UDP-N-acetylmuramate--alanine ligase
VSVDLERMRHIHVVGIGGAGMSAIATVLADIGHLVTGSDLKPSAAYERLLSAGFGVAVGHRAEHISTLGVVPGASAAPDLVTRSSAVPDSNVEIREARRAGIPVCSRADILAAICRLRRTLAIAGTHGKTTTSSMLALILSEAGSSPSFIVGGDVNEIGSGAVWAPGEWLVVEADESDGTFLQLAPEAAVVTSVEADHFDRYGSLETLQAAFGEFLDGVAGFRLVCVDDPWGRGFAADHPDSLGYGRSAQADLQLVEPVSERTGVEFTLRPRDGEAVRVRLPAPGVHNALNAAAAMGCARHLGVPLTRSAEILTHFGGVARRYEFRGEAGGVTFVDDYAHLPGEVSAILATARAGGWRRIVCVYQPHRYSRTATLWRDFGEAFGEADLVALTDVYAAGEPPVPGVKGKLLVDSLLETEPHKRVAWLPHREDLVRYLIRELRPGDLCLTLNAGDLTTLPAELIAELG